LLLAPDELARSVRTALQEGGFGSQASRRGPIRRHDTGGSRPAGRPIVPRVGTGSTEEL